MSVKIRLRRVGAKKQPAYRIVVADSRAPRDGRFIEIVGAYNPLTDPSTVQVHSERALYWLSKGAQPTDVVKKLFIKQGVWATFTGEVQPEAVVAIAEEAPITVVEAVPEVEVAASVEQPVAEAPVVETPVLEATEEASVAVSEVTEAPAEAVVTAPAIEEEAAE